MPMRLIILSVFVFVGQIALAICQTPQTNVVTICAMNDVSPERVDRMVERISNLESRETATSATTAHRIAAVEAACDQNRSRIEKLNDRNDGELIKRAGKFYAERYGELKAAHDRFMTYVDVFLVVLTILFAIVGPVAGWFGILKPLSTDRRLNREWNDAKTSIQNLQQHAMSSVVEFQKSKAELYFQIAKSSFVQYQQSPNEDLLEIVIKDLSQAIKFNIGARDARGLKSAIALLNIVVNKAPDEEHLPQDIVLHRMNVLRSLKTWDWGVEDGMLELVFEGSGVSKEQIKWSITNFKRAVARCRDNA